MPKVTATVKVTFNAEDSSDETVKEALYDVLETRMAEDDLFSDHTKLKIKEDEEDEDYEDDDE